MGFFLSSLRNINILIPVSHKNFPSHTCPWVICPYSLQNFMTNVTLWLIVRGDTRNIQDNTALTKLISEGDEFVYIGD